MNGLVSLSEDITVQNADGSNAEILVVDWGGLSITNAGFVAIVVHVFSGNSFEGIEECKLSCEWNGTLFFDHDCSDVVGTGFFWGFAFKDDNGQW